MNKNGLCYPPAFMKFGKMSLTLALIFLVGLLLGVFGSWTASLLFTPNPQVASAQNSVSREPQTPLVANSSPISSSNPPAHLSAELSLKNLQSEHNYPQRSITELADLLATHLSEDDDLAIVSLLSSVSKEKGLDILIALKERKIEISALFNQLFLLPPCDIGSYQDFRIRAQDKDLFARNDAGFVDARLCSAYFSQALMHPNEINPLLEQDTEFTFQYFFGRQDQLKGWFTESKMSQRDKMFILGTGAKHWPEEVAKIIQEGHLTAFQTEDVREQMIESMQWRDPSKLYEIFSQFDALTLEPDDTVNLFTSWGKKDSLACANYIKSMPNGIDRDLAISGMVLSTAEVEPKTSFQWATAITDPEIKRSTLRKLKTTTGHEDS